MFAGVACEMREAHDSKCMHRMEFSNTAALSGTIEQNDIYAAQSIERLSSHMHAFCGETLWTSVVFAM